MNKIVSILFILILVAGVVLVIRGLPEVNGIISCYETNTQTFDDIEVSSRSQGWDDKQICKVKHDILSSTNECLLNLEINSKFPKGTYSNVISYMHLVRSDIIPIAMLKQNHDSECSDYPNTMFEPPE